MCGCNGFRFKKIWGLEPFPEEESGFKREDGNLWLKREEKIEIEFFIICEQVL